MCYQTKAAPSLRLNGTLGARAAYYGHKHTYQRTVPLVGGVVTPNNADGSNPGTIYYTAGNAGAPPGHPVLHRLFLLNSGERCKDTRVISEDCESWHCTECIPCAMLGPPAANVC